MKYSALVPLSLTFVVPLASFAVGGPALADFTTPHKWTDSVSGTTYVYIPGQTPGQPVSGFTTERAASLRTLTLNNCGWTSFTKSATSPPALVVGQGVTVNWAGKSNGVAPTCTKDAAPAITYTTSNNAATGTVIDDGSKIWIRGGTTAGAISIAVTASGAVTTVANPCGFLRIGASLSRPMVNFKIGATDYTLAGLPSVTAPMICRKVGLNSVGYVPL